MKPEYGSLDFSLNGKSVDDISDFSQKFFLSTKVDKKDISRCRLSIEELLLNWIDKYGEGSDVTISYGKRFFKRYLSLKISGEPYNPFKEENENIGSFGNSILKAIGTSPEYTYTSNKNCFTFKLKKKRLNPIIPLIITAVSAIIVGLLGMLLPESIRSLLLNDILTPIHDTFLNILGCAAGPMTFLSVAWGIYGIGDASTLSKIGKKMISFFLGAQVLILLISGAVMLPFFNLNLTNSSNGFSGVESIFRLLLDIIPKNIFSPFIDGNSLQIILLAFIIGIAMLFLGKQTAAVAKAVEQINYIVQFLMEFISSLVPYFIFIVMLKFIWSDTLKTLIGVAKFILIFALAILCMLIITITYTSIRHKTNPLILIKKGLPTLLIAITTASSAASFGTNLSACENKYGIDKSITSFGIPLGMIMYKPTTAISYLAFSLFFAEMYHVECSVTWLIIAFIIVNILAVATPPIPGGALTAYTIIFMQLKIPMEALAITLAIDVIVDFIATGFDQFSLPFAFINQANKFGLLDYKKLRSKK